MKLTKSLDIAFRLLVRLAQENKRLSSRELAHELRLPYNHLVKVLYVLAKNRFIRTTKGKGGGVELAKAPKEIRLSNIIHLIEGEIYLMECTVNKKACSLSPQCLLRQKIKQAQESMWNVFRETTLENLLPQAKKQGSSPE